MPIIVPSTNYAIGPPQIARDPIPSGEQEALPHVVDLLASLGRYERQFQLALMLFDLSQHENAALVGQVEVGQLSFADLDSLTNTLSGWQRMAARDGALAIYHFGQALAAVSAGLRGCPTLNAVVDHTRIRLARRSFAATFPEYDAIRHVVGHAADFSATPMERRIHSITGPWKLSFGRVTIEVKDRGGYHQFSDNLYDRTYCVTYKGRAHNNDISDETLNALSRARERVYSAFSAAV